MINLHTLIQILLLFSSLSLLSIGGGNTVLSEMHRKTVEDYHWLDDKQFTDVFALSQSAPGPSTLIVAMLGYRAAGMLGAILATLAMALPAGILVYLVSCVWERAKDSPIRKAVEKGLAPLTVGLIFSSGWVMTQIADHDWQAYALTAICTVILTVTKINPLFIVACAGMIGWLGWV